MDAFPLALATLSTIAAAFNFSFDPFVIIIWTTEPALLPCDTGFFYSGPALLGNKNTTCFIYRQPHNNITYREHSYV